MTVMPRARIASLMREASPGVKLSVSFEPEAVATLASIAGVGWARSSSSSTAATASRARVRSAIARSSPIGVRPPSASKSRWRTRKSSSSSPFRSEGLKELSYLRIEPMPEQIRSEPATRKGMILAPTRISDSVGRASLPEAHSRSSQTAIRFSAISSRAPPSIDMVTGAPSMPPFWVPCTPMARCRQRQRASR